MRLVRFGPRGAERPGALLPDGRLADLSETIADLTPDQLAPEARAQLARAAQTAPTLAIDGLRFGPPLSGIGKIVCVGPNYRAMTLESGGRILEEPRIYMKAATAVTGPNDDVVLPAWAQTAHWEAELAVVIGRTARAVDEAAAMAHVAGYAILDDMTDRATESAGGGESVKGRSHDGFGPFGPWLVTADEPLDPHGLAIRTRVNGIEFQSGSTADMVFRIPALVAAISRYMTLLPGDVISTGTPGGVGLRTDPPTYLKAGDLIEIEIAGLGRQRTRLVASNEA